MRNPSLTLARRVTFLAMLGVLAPSMNASDKTTPTNQTQLATFGGGCFWCIEAVFERFHGVKSVMSGYAGGKNENPTYKQVCGGNTDHAEVIQLEFDPHETGYGELLELFWEAHDPTTLNRQGNDIGTQYRSVIFYQNEEQKQLAEKSKAEAAKRLGKPVVTEIVPLTKFYPAEGYHQDYYRSNPGNGYCTVVIKPKLEKLKDKLTKPKP